MAEESRSKLSILMPDPISLITVGDRAGAGQWAGAGQSPLAPLSAGREAPAGQTAAHHPGPRRLSHQSPGRLTDSGRDIASSERFSLPLFPFKTDRGSTCNACAPSLRLDRLNNPICNRFLILSELRVFEVHVSRNLDVARQPDQRLAIRHSLLIGPHNRFSI